MSEFRVEVIQIGKVGKHPNADTLSITQVLGSYPVIFRTGEFAPGDKAVYVSVDALVPKDDPRWSFLEGHNRIKARRLRGIFSMGILTAADPAWELGQDVRAELGITKYEPPQEHSWNTGGTGALPPPLNWPMYDLEGLRRFPTMFTPGEEVIVTEKIHGCNARFSWQGDKLHIGSHRQWKSEDCVWGQAAKRYPLERLAEREGWTLYGEVFGQVQDLKYGCHATEVRLVAFDARGPDGRWAEWDDVVALAALVEIPMVPVLYRGPWKGDLLDLAEGKTTMPGANHVREGIVIQPALNRYDQIHGVGRVKLKYVGEGYLLRRAA